MIIYHHYIYIFIPELPSYIAIQGQGYLYA